MGGYEDCVGMCSCKCIKERDAEINALRSMLEKAGSPVPSPVMGLHTSIDAVQNHVNELLTNPTLSRDAKYNLSVEKSSDGWMVRFGLNF